MQLVYIHLIEYVNVEFISFISHEILIFLPDILRADAEIYNVNAQCKS